MILWHFLPIHSPHSPYPFLGSCVPNNQRSSVQLDSVQRNRRLSRFLLGPHLDERKSFRRPGSGIAYMISAFRTAPNGANVFSKELRSAVTSGDRLPTKSFRAKG